MIFNSYSLFGSISANNGMVLLHQIVIPYKAV